MARRDPAGHFRGPRRTAARRSRGRGETLGPLRGSSRRTARPPLMFHGGHQVRPWLRSLGLLGADLAPRLIRPPGAPRGRFNILHFSLHPNPSFSNSVLGGGLKGTQRPKETGKRFLLRYPDVSASPSPTAPPATGATTKGPGASRRPRSGRGPHAGREAYCR